MSDPAERVSDGFVGRPPDYVLSALSKQTEHRGKVGCAWKNEDGTFTIKLNPFVVLSAGQDLVLTLFPSDMPFKGKKKVVVNGEVIT